MFDVASSIATGGTVKAASTAGKAAKILGDIPDVASTAKTTRVIPAGQHPAMASTFGDGGASRATKSRTNWGPEHGKGNIEHNNAVEDVLDAANARGASDIRKNRVQRDAAGNRMYFREGAYNRPDAAWIENGTRHNYNRVSDVGNLDRELDAYRKINEADPNAVNWLEF